MEECEVFERADLVRGVDGLPAAETRVLHEVGTEHAGGSGRTDVVVFTDSVAAAAAASSVGTAAAAIHSVDGGASSVHWGEMVPTSVRSRITVSCCN